ncbi:unnamed protein product, partial [Allacma fusca]
ADNSQRSKLTAIPVVEGNRSTVYRHDVPWDFNSDDEGDDAVDTWAHRTALIFIISASPEMFRPWGRNDDKPIVAALKVCEAICRSKIISSPKDKIGILFSHTEFSSNALNFDNLYVLQPLTEVTTDLVASLRKKFTEADLDGFEDKIEAKDMSKKIMFFTSDDDPHTGDPNLKQSAVKKFRDIGKVDFSIITFQDNFDPRKFYGEILDDDSAIVQANNSENLLKVVRMKQRVKRPTTRSTLELAPGIKLGVGMYTLVRKALKPKTVPVNIRTNEAVTVNRTTVNQSTGLPVLKAEVKKYIEVAGEEAEFTSLEVKDWKYNFESGIFLVGFLDEAQLDPFGWFRSGGYFLYPDEDRITGSTDLFTSLLRRCDELKKVVLVRFVKNRGQDPKLGCLIPSVQGNLKFGPTFPQGFHLIVLPFADEIRHHNVEERPEASPDMVELMEVVVKKLTQKNFNVMDVPNPELYYKWKDIESSALNLPSDNEEFVDFTKPNVLEMRKRAGDFSQSFNDEILKAAGGFRLAITNSKSKTSGRAAKLPKLDKRSALNFDMRIEWSSKRLEKLTVETLKAFTNERNIKVTSSYTNSRSTWFKKSDYIAAIDKYFGSMPK